MTFVESVESVGKAIDGVGVAVIVVGAVLAAVVTFGRGRSRDVDVGEVFRRRLGRSILLGLEFLVAADIELEMTGSWPWQRKPQQAASGRDATG